MYRQSKFRWHRIVLLLLAAAVLSQQGCVHRKRYSLSSFWIDYNTLRAPAIFFQKREHFPYKATQVSLFHWQYGVTPGRNVKYVRPDLVRENMPAPGLEGGITHAGMVVEQEPAIKAAPSVSANGPMSVPPAPQPAPKKKPPAPPQLKLQSKHPHKPSQSVPPPPAPAATEKP